MPSDVFTRAELVRRGGLRDQLFALLETAGLRQKDIAERLGNDASKVSRIKAGQQAPTETDIRIWAGACGADPAPLLDLLIEAHDAARASRLGQRANQADTQRRYIELYRVTPLVREFQSAVVPGLLQTSSYARQMLVETKDLHDQLDHLPDDIENALTARMARQAMLYEPGHTYEFLIDEPVLRRLVVSPTVLRAQLDRLVSALSIPSLRLGIIPMTARLRAVPWLPIAVFVGETTEALIETPAEERFYSGEAARPFTALLDRLWTSAVEDDEARRLIIAARDALPDDS
jgi:transcriptional regulator with XRE-family HTH domain